MTKSTPLEIARASRLNTKLRLDQINLFQVSARHLVGSDQPRKFGFAMTIEPVEFADTPERVVGVFPLKVVVQQQDAGALVDLAELLVVTRAVYRRQPTWLPDDGSYLPDYLGLVGWMHVWPYARAEVQSLSVKLGFPALLLPVMFAGQTATAVVRRIDDTVVEGAPKPKGRRKSK